MQCIAKTCTLKNHPNPCVLDTGQVGSVLLLSMLGRAKGTGRKYVIAKYVGQGERNR